MSTRKQGRELKSSRREVIRSEALLLGALVRDRTHRHQLWLRYGALGLHRIQKVLRRCTGGTLSLARRALERGAAECVSEMRMVRVDTIGAASAILAILARLHLLVSIPEHCDPAAAMGEVLTLTTTRRARKSDRSVSSFRQAVGEGEEDDTFE